MTDVIVIGGDVIGLSIARELSRSGKETIVLEKNERAGDVTSSRNSGVIHAGIYYPEDYLKTRLCVEGNKLIYEYAEEKKINHKKYGKYQASRNPFSIDAHGNSLPYSKWSKTNQHKF